MTAATVRKLDIEHHYMTIQSDVLGPIDLPEDDIITFPNGLLGFPDCRGFVLVKAEREGLFWLQSSEHSSLTFVLADPFAFVDDYTVDLPANESAELEVETPNDVLILNIVTLPATADESPTVNLQGPIALNLSARMAKQIVLQNADYGTRRPVTF